MCCCGGDCRPIGWLLGLPFALLAVVVSFIGAIIWIVGYVQLPVSLSLSLSRFEINPGLDRSR